MDIVHLRKLGLRIPDCAPTHHLSGKALIGSSAAGSFPSSSSGAGSRGAKSPKQQAQAAPQKAEAKQKAQAAPKAAAKASSFGKDLLGKGFDKAVERGSHPPWLVPSAGHDCGLVCANSLTGEKEKFRPNNGKKITWYTCGPTVYDVSHMGHARAYLTFDILRRIMKDHLGYEVMYQINITDIDDKIILRSRQNKLFDDFAAEAQKMKPDALQKAIDEAVKFAGDKLAAKAPAAPAAGASPKDVLEFEKLKAEHALKMGQHHEIVKKVAAAKGKKDDLLAVARDCLMAKLDKEKGHTVSDHSIFDAHARKFENTYFEDMDNLGVLRPDCLTRISEYMDGRVQKFIEKLESLGVAYCSNGSVYFSIDDFKSMGYHYRKLVPAMCASAAEMEEGEGALASEEAEKRNPNDFALWKKSKPGEPAWDSIWGQGRPGWHVECSVMCTDINGESLDIHAGGEDLKFPHHDNEMAQSEAFCQRSQWVNYFWHAGHLHIEGLKMSKSLKNFITIRQALEMHSARQLRMMFLMSPWDKGMNYSDQAIDMAKAEERKAKHFFGSLKFWSRKPNGQKKGERETKLAAKVKETAEVINASLLDNFNTSKVVDAISRLLSECYASFEALPEASLEPVHEAAKLVQKFYTMLGVEGLERAQSNEASWTVALDAFADLRQEIRQLVKSQAPAADIAAAVEHASKAVAVAKKFPGLSECAAALEAFQKDLRTIAKDGADKSKLLQRCDAVRDADFVSLGVRLEDRGNEGYLWMFEDPKALRFELAEAAEKAEVAAQAKIANKLTQKRTEIKVAEKAAVEPKDLFKSFGLYADFDAEGLPQKMAAGEEISAKKKKDFVKDLAKQQKDYDGLLKKAGADGIQTFLAKLRAEAEEMEKQLNKDVKPAKAEAKSPPASPKQKAEKSPQQKAAKSPKGSPKKAPAAPASSEDVESKITAVGDEIRQLKEKLKSEGLSGKKVNDHEGVKAKVAELQALKAQLPK